MGIIRMRFAPRQGNKGTIYYQISNYKFFHNSKLQFSHRKSNKKTDTILFFYDYRTTIYKKGDTQGISFLFQ